MVRCSRCQENASVKLSGTGEPVCINCFIQLFELNVHETIIKNELFKPGEKVAIGASGGKDSTVLAYLMELLNRRYKYGLELCLLSIDEGIKGYRDDALKAVEKNKLEYGLPLVTVSYKHLYGWTMDEIVAKIGVKNNCTFCGVFRRQALDRGAYSIGADKLVTGHNADDIAETVLLNILRGDAARLQRCTAPITGAEGALPRAKPLMYTYEKEVVMYAHYKKLHYFSTECKYAPFAFRGYASAYVKEIERVRPRAVLDIIRSAKSFEVREDVIMPQASKCERCGYISSLPVCKACLLLEGLNTGNYTLGVKKKKTAIKDESIENSQCTSSGVCGCELNIGEQF